MSLIDRLSSIFQNLHTFLSNPLKNILSFSLSQLNESLSLFLTAAAGIYKRTATTTTVSKPRDFGQDPYPKHPVDCRLPCLLSIPFPLKFPACILSKKNALAVDWNALTLTSSEYNIPNFRAFFSQLEHVQKVFNLI